MTLTGNRLKRARATAFAGVRLAAGLPARAEGIADPITGSSQGVGYNGGPVITCPQIYASFWGQLWQKDAGHQARAARLAQFLTDLPQSTFMNVLSQYGAGGGANMAGSFFQSSFYFSRGWYLERPFPPQPGFTILNDNGIQETIQLLINHGAVPDASDPSSLGTVVLVIFCDETLSFTDPIGEQSCTSIGGYHWDFKARSGNFMYYAVVSSMNDDCIKAGCGPNPAPPHCLFSLSWTQEQRVTIVASHEFAEMCTDPQSPTGWSPEIGDMTPCAGGIGSITVGSNTWSVQPIYDLTQDLKTNGATYCSASAPQPLNPQPAWNIQLPGWSGQVGARIRDVEMVARFRPGHVDRLLPLPPVYVDEKKKGFEVKERDLRHYLVRMAHPIKHSHLFAGWPEILRRAAALVESGKF